MLHLPRWLKNSKQIVPFFIGALYFLSLALFFIESGHAQSISPRKNLFSTPGFSKNHAMEDSNTYLPLIQKPGELKSQINVPHFDGDVFFSQSVVFWFGKVTPTTNYADVRLGYNDTMLKISIHVFDRQLWLDTTPDKVTLTDWDAVSIYLDVNGASASKLTQNSHHFVVQLSGCSPPWDQYRAAYQGSGSGWLSAPTIFTSSSCWRGEGWNDESVESRGWNAVIEIPFASLGLEGPPEEGKLWRLGVGVHDRDDGENSPIPDQTWPAKLDTNKPDSWGQLRFGLPTYTPPNISPSEIVTIRHGLKGVSVVDAHVGGHTVCGQDFWPDEFFTSWGNANYAGYQEINIQNQWDVADFPCFSKYYITFPLESIPPGKVVISAKLTMQQFGNSGQGYQPSPQPSLIQVFTIGEDWNEGTLTWNNAPLAVENVSAASIDTIEEGESSPQPREWDLSKPIADAYQAGMNLRLALYSADTAQHSGKYFYTSDLGEWGADWRPTLEVVLGDS